MPNELHKTGIVLETDSEDPFIINCLEITGNVWWVDSVNGDAANPGTEESPFALLSEAVSASSSSVGDIIILKANHTESFSSVIVINKPVQIFGLGFGSSKPGFTKADDGGRIDFTVQHVSLNGVRFPEAAASTLGGGSGEKIRISATNAKIKDCAFLFGVSDQRGIEIDAALALVDSCTFEITGDGLNGSAVEVNIDSTSARVKDCSFNGGDSNWFNGAIYGQDEHKFIYERPTLTNSANIVHTAAATGYIIDPSIGAGSRIEV